MNVGVEGFFRGLLEDKSLGLGGVERALAPRGLDDLETEQMGKEVLEEYWRRSSE